MAKLSEWDFFNRNVQSGLPEGQFMSSQYTLIGSGPPNLAFLARESIEEDTAVGSSGESVVFPMGVTQRVGFGQTRQHARVMEIGSERSYWISGRTVGQLTIGRVMYHGPSLLRILMAYYKSDEGDITFPHLFGNNGLIDQANENRNPHEIRISPGYNNVFMNLASDLFTQTMGMAMYFRDSNDETVFACYAENCVIPSHGLGMDVTGVIQENAQVQFERLVPIQLSQVVALTDIDSSHMVSTVRGREERWTGRNY